MLNRNSELDRERELLESEIHEFQESIRSYISGEQQFEVYQQFIEEREVDSYTNEILTISTQ